MEKVTVPREIVEKLNTRKGGMQSVIEQLEKDGIKIKYDGPETSTLEIVTDQDIAEIVINELYAMSDIKPNNSNKRVIKGELLWSLKGQDSTLFNHLFIEEKNYMEKLVSISVKTKDDNEVTTLSFPLSRYKDLKTTINKLETDLSESVACEIKFAKKLQQKANAFVRNKFASFIAFVHNDQIRILSRSENGRKDGERAWEAYSKNESIKQYEANENSKLSSTPKAYSSKGLNDNDKDGTSEKVNNVDKSDQTKETGPETENQHVTLPSAPPADASFAQSKIPRTQGFTKGEGDDAKYTFIMGRLTVLVYKKSITELNKIDVIVNAANEHLAHGGGVAYYIAKAAGKKINDECKRFISQNKKVNVTENFVSGAGDLKYKAIIHAVGPQWYDYDDRRDACARDLHKTVINALEVAEKRGWASIALPAISSAIFGVPKILCAEMYIKAFETFASRDDLKSLKEIHFVDLNDEILQMVKETHQIWVEDPSKLDFLNANHYGGAPSVGNKTILKKTSSSGPKDGTESTQMIKIIKETTTMKKKRKIVCVLPRDVTLFVYEGSVLDMEAQYDAITCPCEGVLSDLIAKEVGTAYYDKQLEAFRDKGDGAIFSIQGKGDKLSKTRIVHIVHKRSHFDESEQSLKSLSWRTGSMLTFLNKNYSNPTFPCLLPGKIKDLRKPVKNFVQEILAFCETADDVTIKELHVVDTNPAIVQAITSEIRSICSSNHAQTGVLNGPESASNDGWTKHTTLESIDAKASVKFDANAAPSTSTTESECPICLETVRDFIALPCNHQLCKKCTDNVKKVKPQCPFCSKTFGTVTGNQPRADMYFRSSQYSLPGYDDCTTIEIVYDVPAGKQTSEHPRPGRPYAAVKRRAFLPDNKEGKHVLHLLRRAFDRRLIFTIGESRTSGMEGVVTWNDIHHKTRPIGGPEGFGYPDPTYLRRVQEELAAKGVVE